MDLVDRSDGKINKIAGGFIFVDGFYLKKEAVFKIHNSAKYHAGFSENTYV